MRTTEKMNRRHLKVGEPEKKKRKMKKRTWLSVGETKKAPSIIRNAAQLVCTANVSYKITGFGNARSDNGIKWNKKKLHA